MSNPSPDLYDVKAGALHNRGSMSVFKWQPNDATYEPCSPYPSVSRFGDGTHKTVYFAESMKGAMAEFFRRSPELLDFQDDLAIVLYQLEVEIVGDCLDLRGKPSRSAVGITLERLTSSETDETVRYQECRELAADVVREALVGVVYPSAAATWNDAWNLVLLGDQSSRTWECKGHSQVPPPHLAAGEVSSLPVA